MDRNQLLQNLNKLGITGKESSILSSLITFGPMKIADLSKKTGIPRSSIYRHINPLEKKGLVSWVMGLRSNLLTIGNFEALSPDIEYQKIQLQEKESALNDITQTILLEGRKSYGKSSVNYYEGVNGIRQLIWNSLNTKTNLKAYTNATRRDVVGKSWLARYCMEFVHRGLKDQVLCDVNYAKNAYTKFGGRANYFAPVAEYNEISEERVFKSPLINIKGEIYIYDDVVAAYSWENGYLVGTEIISKFISATQQSIFDVLWNMTTPEDNIKNLENPSKV